MLKHIAGTPFPFPSKHDQVERDLYRITIIGGRGNASAKLHAVWVLTYLAHLSQGNLGEWLKPPPPTPPGHYPWWRHPNDLTSKIERILFERTLVHRSSEQTAPE